jgi:hypothetical protein
MLRPKGRVLRPKGRVLRPKGRVLRPKGRVLRQKRAFVAPKKGVCCAKKGRGVVPSSTYISGNIYEHHFVVSKSMLPFGGNPLCCCFKFLMNLKHRSRPMCQPLRGSHNIYYKKIKLRASLTSDMGPLGLILIIQFLRKAKKPTYKLQKSQQKSQQQSNLVPFTFIREILL